MIYYNLALAGVTVTVRRTLTASSASQLAATLVAKQARVATPALAE